MHLVKSYGQKKIDTDYLGICLLFWPQCKRKKWKPALIARSKVGLWNLVWVLSEKYHEDWRGEQILFDNLVQNKLLNLYSLYNWKSGYKKPTSDNYFIRVSGPRENEVWLFNKIIFYYLIKALLLVNILL